MAEKHWAGGASKTAEINEVTFTPGGGWADTETITFTLTDEGGGSHAVITTLSSPADNEAAVDQTLTQLQASTDVEFLKVTWAKSGTTIILGTAKTAGIPFHLAVAETSGNGSLGLVVDGTGLSVVNSGPNAVATLANWLDPAGAPAAAIPVAADDVRVDSGAHAILYDLDQSAIDLIRFTRGPGYFGQIGNPGAGFYLKYDVTSGVAETTLNSSGGRTWFSSTATAVKVTGAKSRDAQAVKLAGDMDDVYLLGPNVAGTVTFAASMTLDNVYVSGVALSAIVKLEANIASLDLVEQIGDGVLHLLTNPITLNTAGATGSVLVDGDETITTLTNRAASLDYTGTGDITTLRNYNGRVELRPSEPIAIATVETFAGVVSDEDSPNVITYTTATQFGGRAQVTGIAVATF